MRWRVLSVGLVPSRTAKVGSAVDDDARQGRHAVKIERIETLSDNWYRLDKVTFGYTRRDGTRQRLDREVYHNGPGAAVLLLDTARETVVLTRQFRIPAYLGVIEDTRENHPQAEATPRLDGVRKS